MSTYNFKAIVGVSRPTPNHAFLASLNGDTSYKAAATHWLAIVLASHVTDLGSIVHIPIRLCIFVFLPSVVLDNALDSGSAVLFPLPLGLSEFLKSLLDAGLPSLPLAGPRAAQQLVSAYASRLLPPARALLAAGAQVISATGTTLEGVSPSLVRGCDPDNTMLAWLLVSLPGYYIDMSSGSMPSALALLRPECLAADAPAALACVEVVSAFRETQPEPPFDELVVYHGVLAELRRRRQPTEEGRFAPLFEAHWRLAYTPLTTAFPAVSTASQMKRAVRTLAQAADIAFTLTPSGVDGICISIIDLLRQLEANAPEASSDTEARIKALVGLLRRAASQGKLATAEKPEGEERFDTLLGDTDYATLYSAVLALNTASFIAQDAVRVVCTHKHPAGHISMATTRIISQMAWSSVLSMRQKVAWQAMFDKALAVCRNGALHLDWGTILPMRAEVPVHAQWLIMGQLDKIPDWWAMLTPWICRYHGAHVLSLPQYASTDDPLDFWLSTDRLRLCEPALNAVFAHIGHGGSRSLTGSFREWMFLHVDRCTQLNHIPAGSLVQSSLVTDMKSALRLLFSAFSESVATMFVRPFHEAKRQLFNPPDGAAKSFARIDETIIETQKQLVLARTGQAAYQAIHLQQVGHPGGAYGQSATAPPLANNGLSLTASPSGLALSSHVAGLTDRPVENAAWPTGLYEDWGVAAVRHGVWRCPEGLAFGNMKVAASKSVTFVKGTCLAAAAPSSNARGRSKWCVNPSGCKALGYAAHERPSGTVESDFTSEWYDVSTVDNSSWTVIMATIPAVCHLPPPKPPWSVGTGPVATYKPVRSPGYQGGKGADAKGSGKGKGKGGRQGKGKGGGKLFEWLPAGSKSTEGSGVAESASPRYTPSPLFLLMPTSPLPSPSPLPLPVSKVGPHGGWHRL